MEQANIVNDCIKRLRRDGVVAIKDTFDIAIVDNHKSHSDGFFEEFLTVREQLEKTDRDCSFA